MCFNLGFAHIVKTSFGIIDGGELQFHDQHKAEISASHLANIVYKYRDSPELVLHISCAEIEINTLTPEPNPPNITPNTIADIVKVRKRIQISNFLAKQNMYLMSII